MWDYVRHLLVRSKTPKCAALQQSTPGAAENSEESMGPKVVGNCCMNRMHLFLNANEANHQFVAFFVKTYHK